MYCICCKKDKISIPSQRYGNDKDIISEEDYIWLVEKKELDTSEEKEYFKSNIHITSTNNRMWNGGIVHIIDAGYGSNHDTDKYVIAICDDCITKEVSDGTLLYHGNYMYPEDEFTHKEINKSKQIYRRRKNLDNLV